MAEQTYAQMMADVAAVQLGAVQPVVTALAALQVAIKAGQVVLAGDTGSRAALFLSNAAGNASAQATEGGRLVGVLTPAPTAQAVQVNATNETALEIDLSAEVQNATSVNVMAQPQHGAVSVAGLEVTYTPAQGYSGADSFTYTATGAGGTSAAATVTVTVQVQAAAASGS